MDDTARRVVAERHAINVNTSLEELQRKVREHEEELGRVSRQLLGSEAETDSRYPQLRARGIARPERLQGPTAPIEVMKIAFDDMSQADAFLPFTESVLPVLLALRKTHQTMVETRAYLQSQGVSLEKAKRQLETEQADLENQKLLGASLERRIQSLRKDLDSRMDISPDQVAMEKIEELRTRKKHYDRETSKLLKSLNKFIDNHLAPMLAAEELGGPLVGDLMDIDSDGLAAGFTAQGRPKKGKAQADPDTSQRRIDEIWGQPRDLPGRRREPRGGGEGGEANAAGQEMRQLTEQLLNQLMEAGGDGSSSYVALPKETVAVRFLVRSKVAQFHPKDATRLRLVDFGRELDE